MQINISFWSREWDRERRAGFSHLQEDYVIPKIANYCMYYVRVGMSVCVCVCVLRCVCAMSVNAKGDDDDHQWQQIPREKNLIMIWLGEFLPKCVWVCVGVLPMKVSARGFFSFLFWNSVIFNGFNSKDLCVLKESVWKWKWFAINKLKYEWDDTATVTCSNINNSYKKGNFH